jgi:hypothetical protein
LTLLQIGLVAILLGVWGTLTALRKRDSQRTLVAGVMFGFGINTTGAALFGFPGFVIGAFANVAATYATMGSREELQSWGAGMFLGILIAGALAWYFGILTPPRT